MGDKHEYRVKAIATNVRSGIVTGDAIKPAIAFSAPPEFNGQAGQWTPEHFFVAAVASCYLSTFSGSAEASKLPFVSFDLDAEGFLAKDEGGWRFTEVVLSPHLLIAHEGDRERAMRVIEKAGKYCLVARSLTCPVRLEPVITVVAEVPPLEKSFAA